VFLAVKNSKNHRHSCPFPNCSTWNNCPSPQFSSPKSLFPSPKPRHLSPNPSLPSKTPPSPRSVGKRCQPSKRKQNDRHAPCAAGNSSRLNTMADWVSPVGHCAAACNYFLWWWCAGGAFRGIACTAVSSTGVRPVVSSVAPVGMSVVAAVLVPAVLVNTSIRDASTPFSVTR